MTSRNLSVLILLTARPETLPSPRPPALPPAAPRRWARRMWGWFSPQRPARPS